MRHGHAFTARAGRAAALAVTVALLLAGGCRHARDLKIAKAKADLKKHLSKSMVSFGTDEEFDAFVADVTKAQESMQSKSYGFFGAAADSSPAMPSAAAPAAEGKAEAESAGGETSITNVQEAGVDEGDIVKLYKDYLVILRRGRIFTVAVEDRDKPVLTPVSRVDAYPKGFTQGTWYDEMLIHEDRIVVVGYTYALSATEVGLFTIDGAGAVRHDATWFIDSNDYYSSRNYASRLTGDKLVFYMPYYLFSSGYYGWGSAPGPKVKLPQVRRWLQGNETSPGRDILRKTDVYRPVQATLYPTLHVVASCDLGSPDFTCTARAVLGPYSRTFYVSPNAIYVWVSPEYGAEDAPVAAAAGAQPGETRKEPPASHVYMILVEDGSARALKAWGTPVDQFSFKEGKDGFLNVAVRAEGAGDAMWGPEVTAGDLVLLRTPLSGFSDKPATAPKEHYTRLAAPKGYTLQNRFVGDYLLFGTGSGWYYEQGMEKKVWIVDYAKERKAQEIPLSHVVDRIEVMGSGAVVIGADGQDLKFSAVDLGDGPEITDTYTLAGAVQGELRSHGFFYKSWSPQEGVLGLPVRRQGSPADHLYGESAEVLFLKVNDGMKFSGLGSLAAKAAGELSDECVASCVDWYGNSRPIFLGGRIIALMGYELVEGKIEGGALKETARLSYYLPAPAAPQR